MLKLYLFVIKLIYLKQIVMHIIEEFFFQRAEDFASSHNMPIYYVSAIRGDNIQAMFKQLILRILQNDSLLQQIRESNIAYDQTSSHKEPIRRTSSIQVSIQPSSSPRENDNGRNSSGGCCKFA